MTDTQFRKPGGWAALVCAATYIFGFVLLVGPLSGTGMDGSDADPSVLLQFLSENTLLMSVWYLTIYVINGLFLALLVLALKERAAKGAPTMAVIIKTLGLIWATLVIGAGMAANVGLSETVTIYAEDPEAAGIVWQTTELIENGIGGGNEILGGLLAVLIGVTAFQTRFLPRSLAILSLVIGVAGLLTVIAPLEPIAAPIFGLGYIAWFIWTGIVLLTKPVAE